MLERMKQDDERLRSFEGEDYSAHRKSQVRQCLGFSTADFGPRWLMNKLKTNPNIA